MLDMMTEMELVPHRYFHMPGSIQKHMLIYTIMLGLLLTAFFDLSRIAELGIIEIGATIFLAPIFTEAGGRQNLHKLFIHFP
jgi:hypothetical protein